MKKYFKAFFKLLGFTTVLLTLIFLMKWLELIAPNAMYTIEVVLVALWLIMLYFSFLEG